MRVATAAMMPDGDVAPRRIGSVPARSLAPAEWLQLARYPLLAGPTPLTEAPRFGDALRRVAAAGGAAGPSGVWIKREDLAPVGLGGNKLRNLELLVGDALASGADAIVTAGRRWSNHARL